MFFRNITLYRFAEDVIDFVTDLEGSLAKLPLHDIAKQVSACSGFVPPLGRDGVSLTHSIGDFTLFTYALTEKILPASVVSDAVQKRVRKIEEGGGKTTHADRRRIKDDVYAELLPIAFARTKCVNAYLDLADGWLVIDTASPSVAENVIGLLRCALGSFKCTPATAEDPARLLMTDWLSMSSDLYPGRELQSLPDNFEFAHECELRDPVEGGAKWTGRSADLEDDSIQDHLKAGLQAYRLGLEYDGRLSFVLGEDMVIRKLRFDDAVLDDLGEPEDAAAEFDSRFALMTLELRKLLGGIATAFKITRNATMKLDGGDAPKEMRKTRGAVAALDKLLREDGATATLKDDKGKTIATFGEEADPLLREAIDLTRDSGKVSISFIQRTLKVGYNRAARLVETMEEQKIVSAPNDHGMRTVLSP